MNNAVFQFFNRFVRSRMHLLLLGAGIPLLFAVIAFEPGEEEPPGFITRSWQSDWNELQSEIDSLQANPPGEDPGDDPHMLDVQALVWKKDRDPLDVELRRFEALITHMKEKGGSEVLRQASVGLRQIMEQAEGLSPAVEAEAVMRKSLYMQTRALRRQVALSNELLDFEKILFVTGHPLGGAVQGHIKGRSASRGKLYTLKGYKDQAPELNEVLTGVRVANGRNKGEVLEGGAHLSMDLSYDGSKLVFEWCAKKPPEDPGENSIFNHSEYTRDNSFNIYTYSLETGELRQLTDTPVNDAFPCWLPDGRIAFVSERRGSYVRCHPYGPPDNPFNKRHMLQPCCAMYSMKADGSDVVQLSWHETTEVFPRVTNDGRIVYTRWDYIDRDFNAGHSIWFCMPDGRDPRSPHGNYPRPHSTMDMDSPDYLEDKGRFRDRRIERPWTEFGIRPVPGSNRFIAVASIHHSAPKGELVLIDPGVRDDYAMSQVKKITSATLPTESATISTRKRKSQVFPYAWPYPLSEDFYLVSHLPTGSLVLLDRFGNRNVLYQGKEPVLFAVPKASRPRPPVMPAQTYQGERYGLPGHRKATISVMNVYESDFDWPEGTEISALRVVQVFPRPWSSPFHTVGNSYMYGTINRMPLGTVPVEEDGSVYFEAPVECEIYFQALDGQGRAVQSMRSGTYVHPGEQMSCMGCHEDKWKSPQMTRVPEAMKRSPSKLKPEVGGLEPVNYYRLVQPVLEQKCLGCHQKQEAGFTTAEYQALKPYAFYFHGARGSVSLEPHHGGHRSVPGEVGAMASRMGKALFGDQHEEYMAGGHFTEEDRRRITLWLDLNSVELGSSSIDPGDQARQREGGIVWPSIDFDPDNLQRVEGDPVSRQPLKDYSENFHWLNYMGENKQLAGE